MEQLNKKQINIVANKTIELSEQLIKTHEAKQYGKIIAKIQMLSDLIINGYDERIYTFDRYFNSILKI